MKSFIVFAVLVAAALAAPADLTLESAAQALRYDSQRDADAQILRYDSQRDETVNGYNFAYETSNGIQQQEEGKIVNLDAEIPFMIVRGSFAYVGRDGVVYTVTYTADQDGFHPSGDHLPVA